MSFLSTVGRILSEFARLILFVASIVFLLSSLLLFAFTYQSRRDFSYAKVDDIDTGLTVLVGLSIYLIVLAVVGIFASFFSSNNTLKLLAFMLALNVLVGVAVLANSSPKFKDANSDLENKFKEYQASYDWDHKQSSSDQVKNATQAWDNLQADSHCCGLNSPDDWTQYRPTGLDSHLLPLSCCQKKMIEDHTNKANNNNNNDPRNSLYCNSKTEAHWSGGCSIEMEGAFVAILYLVVALICFSLVLGVLASIVIICRPSSSHYDSY